jgi:hypothetical protein
MKRKPALIDPISQATLYVKPYANNEHLGNATAFVVVYKGREYLITNWHVLSGRDAETRHALHSSLAIPNFLRVAHHINETSRRARASR